MKTKKVDPPEKKRLAQTKLYPSQIKMLRALYAEQHDEWPSEYAAIQWAVEAKLDEAA